MSTIYLRVKIKDLGEEARSIKLEELKRKKRNRKIFLKTGINPNDGGIVDHKYRTDDVFWGLRHHRVWDVRREARASQLAYAFLRGRSYRQVEKEGSTPLDSSMFERVAQLIAKFGNRKEPGFKEAIYGELKAWLEAVPLEAAKAA